MVADRPGLLQRLARRVADSESCRCTASAAATPAAAAPKPAAAPTPPVPTAISAPPSPEVVATSTRITSGSTGSYLNSIACRVTSWASPCQTRMSCAITCPASIRPYHSSSRGSTRASWIAPSASTTNATANTESKSSRKNGSASSRHCNPTKWIE